MESDRGAQLCEADGQWGPPIVEAEEAIRTWRTSAAISRRRCAQPMRVRYGVTDDLLEAGRDAIHCREPILTI